MSLPQDVKEMVADFFLNAKRFGQFVDWTENSGSSEVFVKLVKEFSEELYNYGFQAGRNEGYQIARDENEKGLYGRPFE